MEVLLPHKMNRYSTGHVKDYLTEDELDELDGPNENTQQ